MEIWEAKKIESKNFREVSKLHPRLFERESYIDSADFLEKYGLFFEGRRSFL